MNLYEDETYASETEDAYWRAFDLVDPPSEWRAEFFPAYSDHAPPF